MSAKVRIQDDLYEYVNGEWLEKAVIPEDKPLTGGFADLDTGVEKLLMEDFTLFAEGKKTTDIKHMHYAIALYKKYLDVKQRNADGIKPVLPLLEKIEGMQSVEDLNKLAYEFEFGGVSLPVSMGVSEDMADATKHAFIMSGPSIILPDTTYYQKDHPAGKQLLLLYAGMAKRALAFTPLSEEAQQQCIDDALAFDALVAQKVKSQVEWADYVNNHNPMPLEEVAGYVKPFDLKGILAKIYGEKVPETIIVYDPKAIKEFLGYFNEENFRLYKHWAYLKCLLNGCAYLSEELKEISTSYRRALTGVEKDPCLEKQAYRLASATYSEPLGIYYGRTYFGEEAKQDVIAMVKSIIEMYKVRIRENAFLNEATKEKAVLKLSTMAIKMGYPDEARPFYDQLVFDENDSIFAIMKTLDKKIIQHNYDELYEPVDRSIWAMPGHMVNACYNPSANDITFPAAILQKPFYSIHQSLSENLGGIGAVIGHEISHAFDNNGAQFDENGNLFNWWTESDYASFKELTQKMIEQFDGIEFHGGKVNGELVVSENIADNGGMAVTLAIMKTLKEKDYKAYFMNWARVWCRKAKEEYINLLLSSDVHSPAELRANMQPRNFSEWYETFGVTSGDKMYLPEDKRIVIW